MNDPHISVVVPVYQGEACLDALVSRVSAAVSEVTPDFELVLVEDCGADASWSRITDLAATDPRIRGFQLSRNFGQHAAITAGLAQARGDWTVVMDCDLQDPPEEIPRLYAEAQRGHDLVLARRKQKKLPFGRRLAARAYFALMRVMTGISFDGEFGSFSILSRRTREAFLQFSERERHYLFILHWLGFRAGTIDVEHAPRHAGRSSYSFRALVRHALAGIFFQTTTLLRWIIYLGFLLAVSGIALAAVLIVRRLTQDALPGWTSLSVLVLVTGGLTIMSMGVIGLYVGRVFDQVKGRPLYVIGRESWNDYPTDSSGVSDQSQRDGSRAREEVAAP